MGGSVIVSVAHKAIVLTPPFPDHIRDFLPTARPFQFRGTDMLAVPHGVEEVHVLRNMGINAPSPIGWHYNWPGKYRPYLHQLETAGFFTLHRRAYCLNEIGTGKSLSAAWAADFLMQQGAIKRVLILSPLSTLERVWGDTIYTHFPHRNFAVLHGAAAWRRKLFDQTYYDFYIINHDGFDIIADQLAARDDIDLIIIDELAVYRNAGTKRFKRLQKALKNARYWIWGLTGSPIPNSPADAWAQCRLITPSTVPHFFSSWRNQVMQQVSTYKWEPRKEALEIVRHAMRPAVRFERDDCLDLPETIYQTREAELTPVQKRHYKEIMDNLVTEVQGGQVTAVNEAVKLMKLIQAAGGVLYDANGAHNRIDCGPRVQLVQDIIDEAGEKVIVFAPLTGMVRMLHEELSKRWTCEMVYGGTSPNERNRIFGAFQGSRNPHILVADAHCMAHGLTLTEASTIIWYAPITSHETYMQANGRITRAGQKHVANIVHICGSKVEDKMYTRLKQRGDMQGLLLELMKT